MGNAVDRSFDPQNTLFLRISGSKGLARECSRLGLALAGEVVPPGGAVRGWNWPFRLSDRRADHYPKQNGTEPRHQTRYPRRVALVNACIVARPPWRGRQGASCPSIAASLYN